jgi:hypothetical protein
MLGLVMIPTSLFAQPSDSDSAAVGISGAAVALRQAPAEQMLRLSVSSERVQVSGPPPQRAASRDSLRNGAVIGAVIGAAALGAFAATLCHVHRERGGASCAPEAIRFAAIGGAIGLGAGIAIDVARSSGPMVRLTIAF